jgi:hypothetical protein
MSPTNGCCPFRVAERQRVPVSLDDQSRSYVKQHLREPTGPGDLDLGKEEKQQPPTCRLSSDGGLSSAA